MREMKGDDVGAESLLGSFLLNGWVAKGRVGRGPGCEKRICVPEVTEPDGEGERCAGASVSAAKWTLRGPYLGGRLWRVARGGRRRRRHSESPPRSVTPTTTAVRPPPPLTDSLWGVFAQSFARDPLVPFLSPFEFAFILAPLGVVVALRPAVTRRFHSFPSIAFRQSHLSARARTTRGPSGNLSTPTP